MSIIIVGTEPVTCASKEGEEVIHKEETAESTMIAVFLHATKRCQPNSSVLQPHKAA